MWSAQSTFPHRGAINDLRHRAIITVIRSLRWDCRALGFYPGGSPRPLPRFTNYSLLHRPCAPPGKARSKVLDGSPYPDHKDETVSWDCFLSCVQTREQVRPSHFQHAPGCRTTVPPPCMMGNHLVRLRYWCVLHHIEGEQQHIRASM